jgi:hypothetical protein
MKVLVFLQNAWKHDAAEGQTKWLPDNSDEASNRAWQFALWRSQTGKRLKEMLPEGCDAYVTNVSPLIAPAASVHYPMDRKHVVSEVLRHRSDVVLLLGTEAKTAAAMLATQKDNDGEWLLAHARVVTGPHPAWRVLSKERTAEVRREIEGPGYKTPMTIYTSMEPTTDQRLQFYITQMLYCVKGLPPNTVYSFLKLLDVANLLGLAMESVNWDELPYQIDLAYGQEVPADERSTPC